MALVAPSILAGDFANLEQTIRQVEHSGADWVHVDVMDGLFVPNITIGIPVVAALRRVTELPLDVHLMIDRPGRYTRQFIQAGADWLTVHLEADTPEGIAATLADIRRQGCKVALAIKPGTPAEAAYPYLALCDMVLVMTVEPGFGGQKLIPECLEKVREIRRMVTDAGLQTDIEVDGGIHIDNVEEALDAGANVIVAGSAVFHGDVTANIAAFRDKIARF